MGFPMDARELPLAPVLRELVKRFDATNVLVEAGAGLMSRLFNQELVNEAWVFVAPNPLDGRQGQVSAAEFDLTDIAQRFTMRVIDRRHRRNDTVVRCRVGA
jgi:riboflavin biosynthesis pyrimidine reductase